MTANSHSPRLFCPLCYLVMAAVLASAASSQVPSQDEKVRIAVWAVKDVYPGLAEEDKSAASSVEAGEWDYAKEEVRKVAKFMIGGMTEGWTFEYTPSDRARGVKEYFDIQDIHKLDSEDAKSIDYTQVWVEDGKVWCWIEFIRTQRMKEELSMWQKLNSAAVSGTGYGGVEKGFEGITEAAKAAVKDAVRARYRAIIKNKPRLITGRVLVRKPPKVGISSGRYKVALDFFMEGDIIQQYGVF